MSAAFGSVYKLMLFLHIVSVVAAFAPMVIHPVMGAQAKGAGPPTIGNVAGYMHANGRRIHFPALVLTGLFGRGMVFSSEPDGFDERLYDFDQVWVSLSIVVWLALCGVVSGMILPAGRKLAAGDASAASQVALGGQLSTILFLVMLYLMIWKPGF
jgi:hypothetical protein